MNDEAPGFEHLGTVIRKHLGWCPCKQQVQRQAQIRTDGRIVPGAMADREMPAGDFAWYREFRVQMVVLGALMCVVVVALSPVNGGPVLLFVIAGGITALPLAGLTCLHYRDFFAGVVKNGTADEISWCRGPGKTIVCLEFGFLTAIIAILYGIALDRIPEIGRPVLAGFIPALIIVYVAVFLTLLVLWERSSGFRIYMGWPVYYCRKMRT